MKKFETVAATSFNEQDHRIPKAVEEHPFTMNPVHLGNRYSSSIHTICHFLITGPLPYRKRFSFVIQISMGVHYLVWYDGVVELF